MRSRDVCLTLALFGCGRAPEPYGETVLTIDTDVPVPALASKVRLDLYSSSGRWYESREISRPDPRDWPFSLSVVSRTDTDERDILVRIRSYPEGKVRDYRGELYQPRVKHEEPWVAHSVAELCESPPALELGKTVTLRRGLEPFIGDLSGECAAYISRVGSVAAHVDIPEAGPYRFAVLSAPPIQQNGAPNQHVALEIRRSCDSSADAVVCENGVLGTYDHELPDIVVSLQPGRYYVVTSGWHPSDGPSDITLGAAREEAWSELALPAPVEVPRAPLYLDDDVAKTPETEPQPNLTVDRLVALHFAPGEVERASVVLRGACLGTMAKLGPASLPNLDGAETCVDSEGERTSATAAAKSELGGEDSTSLQGQFGADAVEPCAPEESNDRTVCAPGGQFLLGAASSGGHMEYSGVPERLARIEKFWLDRDEVSVGRWRAALELGFAPKPSERPGSGGACHFTTAVGSKEGYALNCATWLGARAFCQFNGGDLPTEAQWEYAATAASRDIETKYPWGDDAPACSCPDDGEVCHSASVGRSQFSLVQKCPGDGPEPLSNHADPVTGDSSAGLGLLNMGGGMLEWTLDAFAPFDSACWRDNGLLEPRCWEDEAPRRTQRGGSWQYEPVWAASASRRAMSPRILAVGAGFRCAYAAKPGGAP